MNKDLLGSLGMAANAKKIIYGDMLFDLIKGNKIRIVIISKDMSEKQKNNLINKCKNNGVEYHVLEELTSELLSSKIGKFNVKAIGIEDANFAKLVRSKF